MLLVAKQRRMALRVAILPLVGLLLSSAAAVEGIHSWSGSETVVAALLAGGMLLYVIGSTTVVRARGHTVRVRSLRYKNTFDARAAAFGVSATYRGRGSLGGATYTVYVTDGMRRSDIATYSSRRALDVARRLTEVFAVAHVGGSSEARGLVTREIQAWKAQEDDAKRVAR